MNTGELLETPFAQALSDLESSDPRRRLQGIGELLTVGDARALQVARSLQHDEDPDIRLEASRVMRKLQKDGVRERLLPGQEDARERFQINTPYELLDEVFFALSRNFGGVVWASVRAGAPKLAAVAVLIWWYPTFSLFGRSFDYQIPMLMAGGFILHQVLMRPLCWGLIGRAVLAGFSDQASRRVGESPLSGHQVMQLIQVNLFERFKLAIPLGMLALALVIQEASFFLAVFGLFFLASLARLNPLNLPMQLILGRAAGDSMKQASDLARERGWVVGFAWMNFLAQVFGLYVLFGGMFVFFLDLFFGCIPPRATFAALLLADVVIDPFWIGYRLLVARLVLNCSPRSQA